MLSKRNPLADAAHVTDHRETILAQNSSFSGTLKCEGPVRVYGVFEGIIETAGTLIVGKFAKVTANILAHEVGVAGTVVGNITALDRVEIYSGGKVYGDVEADSLRIDDGGIFSGQSTMRHQDVDPLMLEQLRRIEAPAAAPEVRDS
jgi:cytoskeletal protein CcmA (bactofilin family)